jgi:predicted nuclease of predicted toxin-antitoxin system
VRFLVDEQLPRALAQWLETQGYDADHVSDLGLLGLSDAEITRPALDTGAVIVTKDEDFGFNAAAAGAGQVLWIRFGNSRTGCSWPGWTWLAGDVATAPGGRGGRLSRLTSTG